MTSPDFADDQTHIAHASAIYAQTVPLASKSLRLSNISTTTLAANTPVVLGPFTVGQIGYEISLDVIPLSNERLHCGYHVKFEYVYRDQAGNIQTATKTDAFPLTLPGTVGDLTAEVLDDAEAMAAKYGHTLISATPLQILVV